MTSPSGGGKEWGGVLERAVEFLSVVVVIQDVAANTYKVGRSSVCCSVVDLSTSIPHGVIEAEEGLAGSQVSLSNSCCQERFGTTPYAIRSTTTSTIGTRGRQLESCHLGPLISLDMTSKIDHDRICFSRFPTHLQRPNNEMVARANEPCSAKISKI